MLKYSSMQIVVSVKSQQQKIALADSLEKKLSGSLLANQLGLDKEVGNSLVALSYNGTVYDMDRIIDIEENAEIALISKEDPTSLKVLRHTTAHLMAYAILKIFPKTHFAIGPVIEDGFYYDMDCSSLKEEDFKKIEAEMRKIVAQKHKNIREELSREAALKMFGENRYKKEIIEDLKEDETISIYRMGDFVDLCRGPHLVDIAPIQTFKLQRIAGAYWRGKSNEKMLTRVYGTAFWSKQDLKDYLHRLEEAKKRDHNKLGREMKLFITDEKVGQGLPLLTERGTILLKILRDYVEDEEKKRGYKHTITPYLAKSDLYKTSGHWEHYRDSMFVINDEHGEFALRPMTCPFHFSLYNSQRRSYRELPVRYAETSTLFRNEASGEMHGLIRVRQFTLADGHVICREDQIEEEFSACLDLLKTILKTIGFDDYHYRLSKWDPEDKKGKYVNDPKAWDYTETKMKKILDDRGYNYVEAKGEAAFYGPKLDVQMKNVYGKEDTLLTVQIDFAQPKRFDMTYIDENDEKKRPYVIHRASIGCYERTIAMLIEKYAGKLPFWMAIDQIALLAINRDAHAYVEEIYKKLCENNIRTIIDLRQESLGKKIKSVVPLKIPALLTIGDEERKNRTVSLKTFDGHVKKDIDLDLFVKQCCEMSEKKLRTLIF